MSFFPFNGIIGTSMSTINKPYVYFEESFHGRVPHKKRPMFSTVVFTRDIYEVFHYAWGALASFHGI